MRHLAVQPTMKFLQMVTDTVQYSIQYTCLVIHSTNDLESVSLSNSRADITSLYTNI